MLSGIDALKASVYCTAVNYMINLLFSLFADDHDGKNTDGGDVKRVYMMLDMQLWQHTC